MNMKQVILTKGLPASGKTTWAKEMLKQHPGQYKRIGNDDLRAMLDDGLFSDSNEKFMERSRDQLILAALEEGKHVIVDATHLSPRHERHIADLTRGKAEVTIQDFTDVPLEECLARDAKRANGVGERVIVRMYQEHLAPPAVPVQFGLNARPAIICDLDGTLALRGDRGIYEDTKVEVDTVNKPVAFLLSQIPLDTAIILVSGRRSEHRNLTEAWLAKNRIAYNALFMRPIGDSRRDDIVKEEILHQQIKDKYRVLFVIDDRNRVVSMWRRNGLVCFQVADGDF